jgi:hypothetical protein
MSHHFLKPSELEDALSWKGQLVVSTSLLALTHPSWLVNKVIQIQNVHPFALSKNIKFTGFFQAYNYFKARDGVNSLWNGYLLGAIFNGIDFCEESIANNICGLEEYIPKDEDKPNKARIARYFKGNLFYMIGSSLLVFPFYNLWIRMMGDIEPVTRFTNIFDCITKVFKNEGIKGFYVGFGFGLLKVITRTFFKT